MICDIIYQSATVFHHQVMRLLIHYIVIIRFILRSVVGWEQAVAFSWALAQACSMEAGEGPQSDCA